MTKQIKIVDDGIAMTSQELEYLSQFVDAGDRPGFYMA